MGTQLEADLVPFALDGIWHGDSYYVMRDKDWLLYSFFGEKSDAEVEGADLSQIDFKGWDEIINVAGRENRYGRDKSLVGGCWKKDNHKIHLVNESPDVAGGGVYLTICADDEESIKQFITDFSDVFKGQVARLGMIGKDVIVKQVL